MLGKVSQNRNLSKSSFGQLNSFSNSGHQFNRNHLAGYVIRSRSTHKVIRVMNANGTSTNTTKPYAPEPISLIIFHLFSTWNVFPNEEVKE